jgi:hypothetical protein
MTAACRLDQSLLLIGQLLDSDTHSTSSPLASPRVASDMVYRDGLRLALTTLLSPLAASATAEPILVCGDPFGIDLPGTQHSES